MAPTGAKLLCVRYIAVPLCPTKKIWDTIRVELVEGNFISFGAVAQFDLLPFCTRRSFALCLDDGHCNPRELLIDGVTALCGGL
jgi:hypothetical protein